MTDLRSTAIRRDRTGFEFVDIGTVHAEHASEWDMPTAKPLGRVSRLSRPGKGSFAVTERYSA